MFLRRSTHDTIVAALRESYEVQLAAARTGYEAQLDFWRSQVGELNESQQKVLDRLLDKYMPLNTSLDWLNPNTNPIGGFWRDTADETGLFREYVEIEEDGDREPAGTE